MAVRTNKRAKVRNHSSYTDATYIYGNTVRVHAVPEPDYEKKVSVKQRPKKRISKQVRKNRSQAMRIGPAYVAFLVFMAVLAVGVCAWYLQAKSEMTAHTEAIARLEEQIADLKEQNTTRYDSITKSVDLEAIKEKALGLGMRGTNSEQLYTYDNSSDDYVTQYQNIPDSGSTSN